MDIQKAEYGTVAQFGTLEMFLEKMRLQEDNILHVMNIKDEYGISVLEHSLSSIHFDIANFLLDNGADVNIATDMNYNELHCISANINEPGAVQLAERLVKLGVDLNAKDKKYQNTALLCLVLDVLKRKTDEGISLITMCLKNNPDIHAVNIAGNSVEKVICERGNDRIKKALNEVAK